MYYAWRAGEHGMYFEYHFVWSYYDGHGEVDDVWDMMTIELDRLLVWELYTPTELHKKREIVLWSLWESVLSVTEIWDSRVGAKYNPHAINRWVSILVTFPKLPR